MWPFSTIKVLKDELANAKYMLSEQRKNSDNMRKEINSLKDNLDISERTIVLLRTALQKSKENDTPKDPKTGRFGKD
jgi:hypothetical protein